MAKDESFDVFSEINMQDLDNAVNNANKEISNRFDLKNTSSKIELDKTNNTVTIYADVDFQLDQIIQVLQQKMVRLGIDIKAIKSKSRETISGDKRKEVFESINGIESELAKKISKDIKDMKKKVQVTIQGDRLRISGKSRDELQEVISELKSKDYNIPLLFGNYR